MQPFAQPFAKYILYCGLHLRNRAVVKDRKVWHKKKATDFVEMVALLNCPFKKNSKLIHYKYTIFREVRTLWPNTRPILYIKN